MYISEDCLDDLLLSVFEAINSGQTISPSKGAAKELRGVLLHLTNPRARLSRTETKGKIFSGLGELLWYLSGTNSLGFIKHYISMYRNFSDDGASVHGGYGPRLFDLDGINQYQNVVDILKNKLDSRQAVIQIFKASDISKYRKDVPCTCTLQFFRRNNELDLSVTMRSNDAFLGLSHDVFAFTMLQELVTAQIGAELGSYKHYVGSLHVYDTDTRKIERFISEGYQSTKLMMPKMPDGDPWPSLSEVLRLESEIRDGQAVNISNVSIDEYWKDIVRLLEVFRASKSASLVEMERLRGQLYNETYSLYVHEKIEEAKRSKRKEPELPWTGSD